MARKNTIKMKQELKWYIASYFLQMLDSMSGLRYEKEYQTRLQALVKYVNEKIEPLDHNDILDVYVIMEQELAPPLSKKK